jgi:hypothetical protein
MVVENWTNKKFRVKARIGDIVALQGKFKK